MSGYNPLTYKIWYEKNKEKKCAYGKNYYNLHKEDKIKYAKEHRKKNPRFWFKSHLKRSYGITEKEFEIMQIQQNNKCAICNIDFLIQKKYKMSIDHCHKTNKIRGILCSKCNISLGHLEKTGFLELALNYLKKYG